MTRAFAPFETLTGFRARGDDRFQASCPTSAHPHGDRSRGLSGRIFGTKVLLKCFAGCSTEDVLAAMGLDWQALFGDAPLHRDSIEDRRCRAVDGFRRWRELETVLVAEELRTRDILVTATNAAFNAGTMSEEQVFEMLGAAYHGYSELEHRFDLLRTGSEIEALEVSRG